jgi:hypothetical protein
MKPSLLAALFSAALAASVVNPSAHAANAWPDSSLGRLEALALIEQLNGELLASKSATTTLEAWCAAHKMASPARVVAIVARGTDVPATAADRSALQVNAREPLRYRRVSLACGTHVLSEAENWYVPSRLTHAINRALDTTSTPFGHVIAPLKPMRETLSVERLWPPLPAGWENRALSLSDGNAGALAIPHFLFRHRAVVFDGTHRPLALVVETYTSGVLDFAH